MPPTDYVYESPDGGDTVYRRAHGQAERELIKHPSLRHHLRRSQLWRGIFQAAEDDAELHDMIDRVEIYYRLKHQTQP